MGTILDFLGWPANPPEQRIITSVPGIERPNFSWASVVGLGGVELPAVTTDSALQVPAVSAAVSFLSRSMANLSLQLHKSTESGSERITGGLATLIEEAPNPEWDSFRLREYFWTQVFTGGRGLLWIERSGSNIIGIWPITTPGGVTIKRDAKGRTSYDIGGTVYPAADVIDVPFMLKSDGLGHYGPIVIGAKAIQLALAMGDYAAKFFAGGGVPPLALEGPLPAGPEAMKRAMADIHRAIETAKGEDKPIFPMPPGHKLTAVGFDPDKGQMTEARRFVVEEIARIWGVPPWFLQDLTNSNFANSENQDLSFVKHLVAHWANKLEQQMNLKLFGQRNGKRYVRHNVDSLLRGDFATRMNALNAGVASAIYTPNEARSFAGLPEHSEDVANGLFIQGAMVPIEKAGEATQPAEAVPATDQGTSA